MDNFQNPNYKVLYHYQFFVRDKFPDFTLGLGEGDGVFPLGRVLGLSLTGKRLTEAGLVMVTSVLQTLGGLTLEPATPDITLLTLTTPQASPDHSAFTDPAVSAASLAAAGAGDLPLLDHSQPGVSGPAPTRVRSGPALHLLLLLEIVLV